MICVIGSRERVDGCFTGTLPGNQGTVFPHT
jgi:hypothetical protein